MMYNVEDIRGDIRKSHQIMAALANAEPDIVIHLAAKPILLESYETPLDFYAVNSVGTAKLLEACTKQHSIKAILNITTDKVYQNDGRKGGHVETDALGGNDHYSNSKACSELITSTYRKGFLERGVGLATARAGNCIGGGDWGNKRIITEMLAAYNANKKLAIRHPEALRPWTYVLDILNGYLLLTEQLYKKPNDYSSGWNFASSEKKPVMDLINEFMKYWQINHAIKPIKKHEDETLLLNSNKAKKLLGWKAFYPFKNMVKETVRWYDSFYSGKDIIEVSSKMLKEFEEKSKKP